MHVLQGTCPYLDLGSSGIFFLLDTSVLRNARAKENVCFHAGNDRRRLYVPSLMLHKGLELLHCPVICAVRGRCLL